MKDKIIEYIKKNRVSTTEVADCLNKSGVVPDVMPIKQGMFFVGSIKWVYAYNESNYSVHEQIVNTNENEIVFIDVFDCKDRAIIGDLVSKYILLYRGAQAIICNGKMRDARSLLKENYPIWCKGFSPVGCVNSKPAEELSYINLKNKDYYDGAIAVCDDCGVVIIPKEKHTQEFLDKLHFIEEQEDIWFDCIDRRKWSTFDTVCLKKYLEE